MSCGLTNRVLKEGTPVHLFFVAQQLLDSNSKIAEIDSFGDWRVENIVVEGTQDDYGYVSVDEEFREEMILLMTSLALNSVEPPSTNECHPSWKQFYSKNIKDINKLNFNQLSEYFNEMIVILHNKGIAYRSNVQRTVSIMKVSHVDSAAIEVIKNTPVEMDGAYLKYDGNPEYSRNILMNFEEYLKYFVIKRERQWIEATERAFSDFSRINSGGESNYNSLLQNDYPDDEARSSVNHAIDFTIESNQAELLLSYMSLSGISPKPSEYASQDYSEVRSRNYRNVMGKIFEVQRENLLEKRIEDAMENGEDLEGNTLDDSIFNSGKSQTKFANESKEKYKDYPEIMISPDKLVLTDNVDGLHLWNDYVAFKEKQEVEEDVKTVKP